MKLIDKDKVISILQDKIADIKLDMKCGFLEKRKRNEKILMLKYIISLVDTLEVKEVDLDNAVERFVEQHKSELRGGYFDIRRIARHFFELGLKA